MNRLRYVRTRVDGFRYGTGTLESQQCDLRRFDDGSTTVRGYLNLSQSARSARVVRVCVELACREVRDAVELEVEGTRRFLKTIDQQRV